MKPSKMLLILVDFCCDLEATLINKEGLVETPAGHSRAGQGVFQGGTSHTEVIREPVILKDRGALGSQLPKMRR